MNRKNGLARFGWALLPLLAAIALGVTARPRALDRAFTGARQALASGQAGAASQHLEEVLRWQPWRSSLRELAGLTALSAGDPAVAIERLSEAESLGAITAGGYLALGDAYRLAGDWHAAVAYWAKARDLGSDPAGAAYRMLEAHRALGDYPAAIGDLQALVALEPENSSAHYQLGLLLSARQPEAALAPLLRAAQLEPGLQDVVRLLEQGLEPDPEVEDPAFVFFNAGRALAAISEWDLAAEAFRQAIRANPRYAEAWAFLGEAWHHLGRDGSDMYATALELDPGSLAANLLYALSLRRQGRPEEALPYLERAAEAAPEEPAVAAETAQAYAEMGDVNAAIASFMKAVDLAPDDAAYLHLLAQFSITNEIQIEEVGLPAARAALRQDAKDPVALDLIGYAYYLRGDWISGLRFLARALEANPGYAPARLHLGMLYFDQGQAEDARRQLQLAVDLAPGSAAALQAQQILETYLP